MNHAKASRNIALLGLLLNIGMAGGKLVAGILGRSSALVADAVESIGDIVGSGFVWIGMRYAAKPADEDHPYGHGKAESLAALGVSLLLFGSAATIAWGALKEMAQSDGPMEKPAWFTLWVVVGVIAAKETMYQVARRAAKKANSTAALADAWHHRADAITSLFTLAGVSIALLGPQSFAIADKIAALVSAAVICITAANLARAPLAELTDSAPPELLEKVRQVALKVPGVCDVEQVLARKSGTQYLMDMHLHVPGNLSVREAHDLSGKVKSAIREALPEVRNVLIHVEPAKVNEP